MFRKIIKYNFPSFEKFLIFLGHLCLENALHFLSYKCFRKWTFAFYIFNAKIHIISSFAFLTLSLFSFALSKIFSSCFLRSLLKSFNFFFLLENIFKTLHLLHLLSKRASSVAASNYYQFLFYIKIFFEKSLNCLFAFITK